MRTWYLFLLLLMGASSHVFAQTDSVQSTTSYPRTFTHRDSLQMAKLNSSGNLMIAGGVGLCGAAGYLLYYGITTYKIEPNTLSPTYQAEKDRNQRQGRIYIVAGSIAAAAGIILTAFGARNKVDFKTRKRMMELEGGVLQQGSLGLALNF